MSIRIVGGSFSGNGGDGIRIEGHQGDDIDIQGVIAEGNGGKGIEIVHPQALRELLGVPDRVSQDDLVRLVNEIRTATQDSVEKVGRVSKLWLMTKDGAQFLAACASI